LTRRRCARSLDLAIVRAVTLHTPLTLVTAVPERPTRTAEAIERTLPPGDVADAAEKHQPPREVRTTLVVADRLPLAALDQRVSKAVVIGIVDEPEPTQDEEADQ
jgi:hypothetical protein